MVQDLVVISAPPGSGSSTIAKNVAKRLKLKFFSAGDLHKKMFKDWKNKEAMAALEIWKTEEGSSKKTHEERDKLITEIAKEGNIVICGKLGIHFLKNMSNNKIWLDVPLHVRALRTSKRDNIPLEEAVKQISEREDLERENWKKMYGLDYFDQKKDADLVVDSSNLTVKQTVDMIVDFVKKNEKLLIHRQ